MEENKTTNILVIWRDKKLNVEINSDATLKEFGCKLQHLTNVKSDTLRLLTPRSSDNSSKLLSPFSDDHSSLSLKESCILEGKSIRMMGVFEDEIKEVSQTGTKADLRIAGFDEEERRLRQRMLTRPRISLKLPQGAYIFGDFRTLHLPGIELNPPPSEALKRMHRLAADPGIVAIMNKHRWRVGIMTEMAPVGYVGVSPTCILGLNKNQGEEISLRLRTDDLKGFRKYEIIKKTLLHELAHMVYSEHDAHFYALDKQLNLEAANLDWTRSRSHTLSGVEHSDHYEEEPDEETTGSSSQKLGGRTVDEMASARATSVAAAYRRLAVASTEPDPDDSGSEMRVEPDPDDSIMKVEPPMENDKNPRSEPDPDDDLEDHEDSCSDSMETEADPDDSVASKTMVEPDPDDSGVECGNNNVEPDPDDTLAKGIMRHEPDPDDQEIQRIQDPVSVICTRLQKSIEMLKSEVRPAEATLVLQTLFKIIGNVIEHPDEIKFRRLRKTNPHFQRNVAKYKAAMEVLFLVGFNEDTISDEIGRSETYVVLKRNDPGLLWLVKSSLEMCIIAY